MVSVEISSGESLAIPLGKSMPSSRFEHISDFIRLYLHLQPTSFLDVGCGFGRWGFLGREFGDIFWGRYRPDSWQVRIDAVEVFEEYITPHHRYIYDNIFPGKVEDFCETIEGYDLIFMGDVLEHLDAQVGEKVIDCLRKQSKKALIIAVPLGSEWPQGEVLGNPYEAHRAIWNVSDLRKAGASYVKVYSIEDARRYAMAIWSDSRLGYIIKAGWGDQLRDFFRFRLMSGTGIF